MKNFLGSGLAFPLHVGGRGSTEVSAGEKSISEALGIIMGTALGERPMLPDFGCKIHDLVFHPVNANTCSRVSMYVQAALIKWEPRINEISVESYPDPTAESTILIHIDYVVRSSNHMVNLVYPFYLRREQDL